MSKELAEQAKAMAEKLRGSVLGIYMTVSEAARLLDRLAEELSPTEWYAGGKHSSSKETIRRVANEPQVGDRVIRGTLSRKVLSLSNADAYAGEVRYEDQNGTERTCWITTWSSWASKADSVIAGECNEGT